MVGRLFMFSMLVYMSSSLRSSPTHSMKSGPPRPPAADPAPAGRGPTRPPCAGLEEGEGAGGGEAAAAAAAGAAGAEAGAEAAASRRSSARPLDTPCSRVWGAEEGGVWGTFMIK